ncbi:MAG: Magnesium transporter MgtE [Anaerolineae bacterium]|nr:Magnesium transporter MgtE [Anaerolineae bacterium]
MEQVILEDVLAQIRAALEANDLTSASAIIESLRPADQADIFWELDEDEQAVLLPKLNPADAADIFEELYDEDAAEIAVQLPLTTLVRIVNEMEPDEAADLLDDLDPRQADAILAQLEAAHQIKPLIAYPDDTAGGLMTSSFIALQRRMTCAQAIAAIRMWRPDEETIYYLFVTDRLKRLAGVVNLRQLIVAAPSTPVAKIMESDVVYVSADTDQEDCADLMQRYDLLALPVVDENMHLLGVITIDDLVDVIQAEASEDIQRLGGSEPLDRAYLDTSIFAITRKRIGWLFLLFGTATLTAGVMDAYQSILGSVVVLSIFIPMLIGTGGNAGSQTTSTIIRALAVGDVEWVDIWRVWLHELSVGAVMGVLMGLAALTLVYFWIADLSVAVTVAASIFGIVVWSTSAGSLLPLIAHRINIDPTVISGPAMSTLVDATGLFIYFNIARFVLNL